MPIRIEIIRVPFVSLNSSDITEEQEDLLFALHQTSCEPASPHKIIFIKNLKDFLFFHFGELLLVLN